MYTTHDYIIRRRAAKKAARRNSIATVVAVSLLAIGLVSGLHAYWNYRYTNYEKPLAEKVLKGYSQNEHIYYIP